MAINDQLRHGWKAKDLTINAVTAGTVVAGPDLLMSEVKSGTLSARCAVTAETNTMTLTAIWEVSADGSTWERAKDALNAAEVALATGTAGTDAAVVRHVSAPPAAYGHLHARCSIVVGVATGGSTDLANVGYAYAVDQGF